MIPNVDAQPAWIRWLEPQLVACSTAARRIFVLATWVVAIIGIVVLGVGLVRGEVSVEGAITTLTGLVGRLVMAISER